MCPITNHERTLEGQSKRRKDPCFLLWAKEREAFDDAADWNVTVVVVESRKCDIIRLIIVPKWNGIWACICAQVGPPGLSP